MKRLVIKVGTAVLAIKGGLDEKIAINSLVLGVIVSLFTITLFTSYLA